jgi:hypothetical protein
MATPRMILNSQLMRISWTRFCFTHLVEYFLLCDKIVKKNLAKFCFVIQIKSGFAEGKDLVVTVQSAMGEEQICALKDVGPR